MEKNKALDYAIRIIKQNAINWAKGYLSGKNYEDEFINLTVSIHQDESIIAVLESLKDKEG